MLKRSKIRNAMRLRENFFFSPLWITCGTRPIFNFMFILTDLFIRNVVLTLITAVTNHSQLLANDRSSSSPTAFLVVSGGNAIATVAKSAPEGL